MAPLDIPKCKKNWGEGNPQFPPPCYRLLLYSWFIASLRRLPLNSFKNLWNLVFGSGGRPNFALFSIIYLLNLDARVLSTQVYFQVCFIQKLSWAYIMQCSWKVSPRVTAPEYHTFHSPWCIEITLKRFHHCIESYKDSYLMLRVYINYPFTEKGQISQPPAFFIEQIPATN